MKISLIEPLGVSKDMIDELAAPIIAAGHSFTYYDNKTTDPAELAARSAGQDIVMIANNPYPAEVVEASKDLKMLAVAFTGIDHVATDLCKDKGIMICNCAGYSNVCVSELVIGMTIDVLRYVNECDAAVRAGKTSAGLCGREIAGKKVGIIGCGNIGFMTAKLFKAFGAEVYACANHERDEVKEAGIIYKTLDEIMSECDIISLHTPNNASTKGLISAEKIAMMKNTAIFINCARGPIVDSKALAEALNTGAIAGAAVDVFEMEPPIPADHPLVNAKNTLVTPHVAFLSDEAMVRRAKIEFDNVMAYLNGAPANVCKL